MSELWALLPAEGAMVVRSAIDAVAADRGSSSADGSDARRADALVQICGAALRSGGQSVAGAIVVGEAHVVVNAATLLGLRDDPAELSGYGPIPASLARTLCADAAWRRLVTCPESGALLDLGRRRYRPSAALAGHVRARDARCRFPGCRQPARRCDLDHVTPFPIGPTSADNLVALCRHHHRLKHEAAGWRVALTDNGKLRWTTPGGREVITEPGPALGHDPPAQ